MLHSIISEYDIFYSNDPPRLMEKRTDAGIETLREVNGSYQPYSFFSTDPKEYLNPKNNINSLYYS